VSVIRHAGNFEDKDVAARRVVLADIIQWSYKSCKDQRTMRQARKDGEAREEKTRGVEKP